mmetsp:Transcript_28092/g.27097  ORF Transcript_28092/g.27097 Transcript_28092/m.27097 type:complete len:108 (+) Transcript_28092:222-545(+)
MGSGRFSQHLSYKAWFNFNVQQRIHYNYLESSTITLVWLLVGGMAQNFGWAAFALGWLHILGRVIYQIGYAMKGPKGRLIGVVIHTWSNFGLFFTAILSGFRMLGYF